MSKRWDAVRGSAGFYITMAVCLLVIGISSYYLLVEEQPSSEPPAVESTVPPVDAYVSAPAPEITQKEEEPEPPVVETISPVPVEQQTTPQMPEIDVDLDDTPVIAEAPLQVVSPLDGEVVTAFAMDQLVYNPTLQDWRTHDGVDIAAELGTSVLAACAGTVLSVSEDALMGTTVVLNHQDGCQTVYANLQKGADVEAGEAVAAGQIIGAVGDTAAAESAQGPHLHFSVNRNGESVDPAEFLK